MGTILTIIGACLQIVLLWLQRSVTQDAEKKQILTDEKKEIFDAVSSHDVSRINSVVQRLRK